MRKIWRIFDKICAPKLIFNSSMKKKVRKIWMIYKIDN